MQNKYSFFEIFIADELEALDEIKSKLDMVLSKIGPIEDEISFNRTDEESGTMCVVTFIKCSNRKRKAQIERYCHNEIGIVGDLNVNSCLSKQWRDKIDKYKRDKRYDVKNLKSSDTAHYTRRDIEVLDSLKNWHPWQKEVYRMVFRTAKIKTINPLEKYGFLEPDKRAIISIVDCEGNSGKSTFWKWMLDKFPEEVASISYGTAGQLRARTVNIGPRKLYIFDLPRTRGKSDNLDDLLSVIEDIKTGKIDNSFYGSGSTLLFDCPHVIVSSNFEFDYSKLSADRWRVHEMKKNKLIRKSIRLKRGTEILKKSEGSLVEV